MRGEALGNKEYQELRCGNLVAGSVFCCCEEHFAGAAVYLFSLYSVTLSQKETQSLC
jgi:hypothetical protein